MNLGNIYGGNLDTAENSFFMAHAVLECKHSSENL
jgi:hypothetical protein